MGIEVVATPGGVGETSPAQSQPVRHPVIAADEALAAALSEKVEKPEEGAAQAEVTNFVPDLPQLGLVDIGDGKGEIYPFRVPFLGHGSILLGDGPPEPVTPTKVGRDVPRTQMRQAIADALKGDELERKYREKAFIADGEAAVGVSTTLIAQALERIPRGCLAVRTCDMLGANAAFAPLKELGRFYQPMDKDGLLPTLEALKALVDTREKDLGSRHGSLFNAMVAGETNRTWQILVVIGDREPLPFKTQELLKKLMQDGPAMGVSLIVSGYDLSVGGRTTRIAKLLHGHAQVSYASWAPVKLGKPPEPSRLSQLAKRAVAVTTVAKPKTGVAYVKAISHGRREQAEVHQDALELRHKFPILDIANLREVVGPSNEKYAKAVQAIAASVDPYATARESLELALAAKGQMTDPRRAADVAMAVAGVDLALSAGRGHGLLPERSLRKVIERRLTTYISTLPPLVTTTRTHDIERLPPRMRPYVARLLGEHPPAWAMQLLARVSPTKPAAREAVARRLQQVFDPDRKFVEQLRKPKVHDAVLELYLLGLLGAEDPGTSLELRTLLDQRAAPKLNEVTHNQLPRLAHGLYESFQARARADRERRREQAAGGLGPLASDADGFTSPDAPYYIPPSKSP